MHRHFIFVTFISCLSLVRTVTTLRTGWPGTHGSTYPAGVRIVDFVPKSKLVLKSIQSSVPWVEWAVTPWLSWPAVCTQYTMLRTCLHPHESSMLLPALMANARLFIKLEAHKNYLKAILLLFKGHLAVIPLKKDKQFTYNVTFA